MEYNEVKSNLEKELSKKETLRKERLLKKHKLYDKVYAPDNKKSEEYKFYDTTSNKYCKLEYKELTDQELNELESLSNALKHEQNTSTRSGIHVMVYAAGLITFAIGFFFGLLALGDDGLIGLIIISSGFVSGTLFLALYKILEYLYEINEKTKLKD
ncbi:hypothetical protein [Liberiplasma polymorphum]|uniref:hypothetical protein n=1 Tax=Liberiplasma polymorphum TaxID=3374570 RepID=UPI0037729F98